MSTGSALRDGLTKSCGCLQREVASVTFKTHGSCESPEYKVWAAMKQRCTVASHPEWSNYGARGIQVCARWESFDSFLADMGRRPSRRHSIDRIDNDGPYSPDNCRWATTTQQARNKRSNRVIAIDGTSMCVADWADRLGVPAGRIYNRLYDGWSEREALFGRHR